MGLFSRFLSQYVCFLVCRKDTDCYILILYFVI